MSIFKESFKPEIRTQLEKRQEAIQKRGTTAIRYFNSRTAWIRMTSSVNVGDDGGRLAQDYVLQGGIISGNDLLSGVGTEATNAYSITTGRAKHRLGMRPMPGITGVDIKTKSAYGSLMEATVNFVCWDIKQLEELELLYMRPNYSVLLEWGWIPYLDNNGNIGSTPPFNTSLLAGGVTKEALWKDIYKNSLTSGGNYNAIYGFVKNYSWSARPDGGYDCTTSIITMGEIIESLKLNWVPSNTNIAYTQGQFNKAEKSNFEKDGPLNKAYQRNYLAGLLYEMYVILKDGGSIGDKKLIKDSTIGASFYGYEFKTSGGGAAAPTEGGAKAESETFVSEPLNIYIKLKDFIAILNKYCILHAGEGGDKSTPIVQVSVTEGFQHSKEGKDLLCLGHPFQISMDPTVCLINNPEFSKSITTIPGGEGGEGGGAEDAGNTANKVISGFGDTDKFLQSLPDGSYFGITGNIYVNLGYLYTLITDDALASQDKKEKKDIALFDFLKNMMSGINNSIGNVATFDIHIDPIDSIARIIDINYVDEKTQKDAYENAFLLEMHNTKSVVRSYKLESQIFPEQSSVVAIGAQAKGGALGSGDNTLIDFNQNLTDRIVPKKELPPVVPAPKDDSAALDNLKANLEAIAEYFSSLDDSSSIGESIISFFSGGGGAEFDKSKASQYTNALKDIISYSKTISKDSTNNRAIIPTKLSLEMDGIGGIIIGSLFKISEDLLPRGYRGGDVGARIGFLVTRIGHTINDNDWVTKLECQFIILDGPKSGTSVQDIISKKDYPKVKRVQKISQNGTGGGGGTGGGTNPASALTVTPPGKGNWNTLNTSLLTINNQLDSWKEARSNPTILNTYKEVGIPQSSDEVPWCAAFVGYILKKSGLPYLQTLSSVAYANYGTGISINNPSLWRKWDVVVWKHTNKPGTGHVSFLTGVTKSGILVAEPSSAFGGNQGDRVRISKYPYRGSDMVLIGVRRNWTPPTDSLPVASGEIGGNTR